MDIIVNILYDKTGVPKNVIESFIKNKALPYFRFNVHECVYEDVIQIKKEEALYDSIGYLTEYHLLKDIIGVSHITDNIGKAVKFQYNLGSNLLSLFDSKSESFDIQCYRYENDEKICNMNMFYQYCLANLQEMQLNLGKYYGL